MDEDVQATDNYVHPAQLYIGVLIIPWIQDQLDYKRRKKNKDFTDCLIAVVLFLLEWLRTRIENHVEDGEIHRKDKLEVWVLVTKDKQHSEEEPTQHEQWIIQCLAN